MLKSNKTTIFIVGLVLLCAAHTALAQPRAEYPRPQFERAEWQNLNGAWTYTFDFGRVGDEKQYFNSTGFDSTITVPYCPESKLSGVEYVDFINAIWYQRQLTVPAAWEGQTILLHFGAVDYAATIYINGTRVLTHYGTGTSFTADITNYVTAGKTANLVVKVVDNLRLGRQPGGKQSMSYYSAGCSYTRVTGIWQTVWMEPVDKHALKSVFATPDIDNEQLIIQPEFYNEPTGYTLTVAVSDGSKTVATKTIKATNAATAVVPIKQPKLWSPETPFLYDVKYTVKDREGHVVDEVASYVGMRKVHCEGGYFYLNNKPYYQRLVLDQGYYPTGIWTAPTDDDLKNDIVLSKACGFNGARLHQKVFEERYFYWADKLGYVVWGEQASWCLDVNNEEAARNFITEWAEEVIRDRNHPSIVTWTPFNETWGARDGVYPRLARDIYALTKALDPTRPVNDASGDAHIITDIWSVHDYTREPALLVANHTFAPGKDVYRNMGPEPWMATYNGQPYMVDEFGGLGWIPADERATSWGYGDTIETLDDFYDILEKEVDALAQCPHVVGFCYTQLTDVEQEKNGMYYYDRRPKFDYDKIRAIFEKIPADISDPQDLTK